MFGAKFVGSAAAGALIAKAATEIGTRMWLNTVEKNVDTNSLKVEVQVPTLNEEHYIEPCLESLLNQPLIKKSRDVSLIVVDSDSTDGTVDAVRRMGVDVLSAPRGKLSARDFAIRQSDADIVVSCDADTQYHYGWLGRLIEPFRDPDVVMTHGSKLSDVEPWLSISGVYNFFQPAVGQVSATNSAFRREAYVASGGFDTEIDEFNRAEIWNEEEWAWPRRMAQVGDVVFVRDAGCIGSSRARPFMHGERSDLRKRYQAERMRGIRF